MCTVLLVLLITWLNCIHINSVRVITKPIYVPQIIEHTKIVPEYITRDITAPPIINQPITTTLPAESINEPTRTNQPIIQPVHTIVNTPNKQY